MTQTVHVRDIRAAGGLKKWEAKAAQSTARGSYPACSAPLAARPAITQTAKGHKPADLVLGYDAERMNGLEARYAMRLEAMRAAGELACWKFEAVKLRLADKTFYTPDFLVIHLNGDIEFHETKGFWRDDARVKIKVAAELFPMFSFVAVQWSSKTKNWAFEFFSKPRG